MARILAEQRIGAGAIGREKIEVAIIVIIDPARLPSRTAGRYGLEVLGGEEETTLVAEQEIGFGRLGGAGIEIEPAAALIIRPQLTPHPSAGEGEAPRGPEDGTAK